MGQSYQVKEPMRSSFHNFEKNSMLKSGNNGFQQSPMAGMTTSVVSSHDKKKNLPFLKGTKATTNIDEIQNSFKASNRLKDKS